MTKKLYQLNFDCGRGDFLEGLFVATEEEIANALGKQLYFGEALGKHSEVHGPFEESDVILITGVSQETIDEVSAVLGNTWSGYNPLSYIDRMECVDEND